MSETKSNRKNRRKQGVGRVTIEGDATSADTSMSPAALEVETAPMLIESPAIPVPVAAGKTDSTPSFAEFAATLGGDHPTTIKGTAERRRESADANEVAPWAKVPLAPPARAAQRTPAWTFDEEPAPVAEAEIPVTSTPIAQVVASSSEVPAIPPVPTPPAIFFGPTGKRRTPAAVLILSILTLGIYGLVWHARVNREMGDFDPQMHVRSGPSALAVTIPWLIGLLVSAAGAARLGLDAAHVALPFDPGFTTSQAWFLLTGLLVVPYLCLVLPFAVVAVAMTAERVRIVEERVGFTTDVQLRPASTVAWLLLPLVGAMVVIGREQKRLNAVWERMAPPTAGRRRRS